MPERHPPQRELSPAKRALLEQRLRAMSNDGKDRAIMRRSADTPAPLSFAQQRLWYLDQLQPHQTVYTIRSGFTLHGPLDLDALHRSLNEVIQRHESLRTTFRLVADEPVQVVAISQAVDLPVIELDSEPPSEREAMLARVVSAQAHEPFDLERGPLIRGVIVRLTETEHVLVIATHHAVFDGWSWHVLRNELQRLYAAFASQQPSPLEPLPIQYADYASWQRDWLSGDELVRQLKYWLDKLEPELPTLEMPTDHPRPAIQTHRGSAESMSLSPDLVRALGALGRARGATLFMVLLAAFKALLSRYTGQEDIVVGTPVANRTRAETEPLIGLLANVLILRTRVAPSMSFRDLLQQVRETCLGAYSHQEMPFERLVQELNPPRDLSRTPLFQALFAFEDASAESVETAGLRWTPLKTTPEVARTDLSAWLQVIDGRVDCTMEYSTDLFDRDTIVRLLEHYRVLLESVAADPDATVAALPMLTAAESHMIVHEWNETAASFPADLGVHQLIERQAAQTPERVAVTHGDTNLTYLELDSRANLLATHLQQLGVQPSAIVGLCLERSTDLLVALLAILKTGAAYLPLDPAFPRDRLEFMLADANVSVLVTETELVGKLSVGNATVLQVDSDWDANLRDVASPAADLRGDSLAYVIYTSGSTGRPKGVVVPHKAVVNFLTSMRQVPGIATEDVLLAVTTLSFDISVLELLLPLTVGARVILVDRDVASSGDALAAAIDDSAATIMQATPSTWRLLLEAGWKGRSNLKVLSGGEALPRDLATALLERVGDVWNMYGPTETTIWSTCHRVTDDAGPMLIGRPIANTQVYVLDDELAPVPIGVAGELYIGGAGVACGYLNRPALTAERFVQDPFRGNGGHRMYRTGDRARFRPDGAIEYLQRLDHQVKVRGFRIEPGEVEAALREHDGVQEAVVVARTYGQGDKRLIAYFVPRDKAAEPTSTELRSFLRDRLPEYMVPPVYAALPTMPLTPNGKIDRKALPEPELFRSEGADTIMAPSTEMEIALGAIWQEILQATTVDVRDNFFDLGGHSLLSMRVIARVEREFGVRLHPRDMVLQTLGQLAALCEEQRTTAHEDEGKTRSLFGRLRDALTP